MVSPLNRSVPLSQMALNAHDIGLAPDEYRTVAVDRIASVVAVHKAYRGNHVHTRSPYSANGIYDTGANTLVSSETGIFEDLFNVPGGSLEVEGLDNNVSVCTHWG